MTDKIGVSYTAEQKVKAVFEKFGGEICHDVLAEEIIFGSVTGYQKEWNINGEKVLLGVEKK